MNWTAWLARKNRTPLRRKKIFHPFLESLESRETPAAVTYVNDNWVLVTDNGAAGLSVGDIVDNRLDTGATLVTATYGVNGFGTVTQDTGGNPLSPTTLSGSALIADAITNTNAGGTVNVLQGSYTEAVEVNKAVALVGAQADVNALDRVSGMQPETILTSTSATATIDLTVAGTIVTGFTINNNSAGAGIATSATAGGYEIRNNIIDNNLLGINLASDGTALTIVEQNVIQNSTGSPPGGVGLLANQALANASIRNNQFSGNANLGAEFVGTSTQAIFNVTISGNQFAKNDRLEVSDFDNSFIEGNTFTAAITGGGDVAAIHVAGGADNLTIAFNTFTDLRMRAIALDASLATTDNSDIRLVGNIIHQDVALLPNAGAVSEILINSASATNLISENIIILHGTLPGGVTTLNGILLDGTVIDTVNITGNVILASGVLGGTGVTDLAISGNVPSGAHIAITSNTFSGGEFGIDLTQGTTLPTLQIHFNNFLNHTSAGLRFTGSDTLDASLNFWGSPSGPTASFNPSGTGDVAEVDAGGTLNVLPVLTEPQLAFGDDFTGVNGSDLSSAWLTALGSFGIQGNAAVAGSGTLNIAVLGTITTDAILQIDVNTLAIGSHADLVARYTGPGDQNMYVGVLAQLTSTTAEARIFVNVNGSFRLLNSSVVNFDGTGTLRFEVVGSSLRLFVNDRLAAQAVDATLPGPGLMGIRTAANVTVDNFLNLLAPLSTGALNFAESFTLADNTSLSTPWTTLSGSFTLQAQAAVGAQALNLATIGEAVTDVSLQATVTLAPGNAFAHVGLVARHAGPGDTNEYVGMLVRINGQTVAQIYRNVNGTWTLLGQTAVTLTGADTLRFDVIGSTLSLYVNDVLQVSATDTMLAAGTVGIRSSANITIDDFTATPRLQLVAPISFAGVFTGANGNSLSEFWQQQTGSFTLQAGTAVAGSTESLATLLTGNVSDVSVTADVTLNAAAGSNVGIVARYNGTGNTNMYLGNLLRTSTGVIAQILVNVNGTWSVLASAPVTVAGTVTLRFDVVGNSLKLFVNDTLAVFTFDSTFLTGRIGLRAAEAIIANFNLDLRLLTTPTLPFTEPFGTTTDNQLSTDWREVAGNYNLQTDAAVGQAALNLAVLNNTVLTNVSETMTVNLNADGFAALVARYSGSGDNNMYLGMLKEVNGQLFAQIWRNVGGVWTQLSSVAVTASGTVTLRFDVIGNTLRLFVNGALTAFALDSSLIAGGVGIRSSQGAVIDNFNVHAA